jgi:hypothetical protein
MAERQQERAELVRLLMIWFGMKGWPALREAARLLEEDGKEIERWRGERETFRKGWNEEVDRRQKAEAELARITDILAELADLMDATVRGDYKPDSFTTQPARLALSPAHQGDQT